MRQNQAGRVPSVSRLKTAVRVEGNYVGGENNLKVNVGVCSQRATSAAHEVKSPAVWNVMTV